MKWTEQDYYGSGKQTEHLKGCFFYIVSGRSEEGGGRRRVLKVWYNFFSPSFRSVNKLLYILSSLVPALSFS